MSSPPPPSPAPVVPAPPDASVLRRFLKHPPDFMSPIDRYPDNDAVQQLVWDASEVQDVASKFQLCLRALRKFPFCVDAYNTFGHMYRRNFKDPNKAMEASRYALDCARMLWPDLEEEERISWGHIENRPFLRAHHGLGLALLDLGDFQGASDRFRFLLRANPSDNQGCRFLLFQALIQMGEYAEAERTAEEHGEGRASSEQMRFRYGFVLIDFLKHKLGVCSKEDLEKTLIRALQSNNYLPDYLLHLDWLPEEVNEYESQGSQDEALNYAHMCGKVWEHTAGILPWLGELHSSGGTPKPDDDGSILFALLSRGKVLVDIPIQKYNGQIRTVEVTSNFFDMFGTRQRGWKLAPGMKEHDPSKIVCYCRMEESFVTFEYSSVQAVYFWRLLHASRYFKKMDAERQHHCGNCYKPATQKCSRCLVTFYCSAECQRNNWKVHKRQCPNFIKN